MDSAGPATIMNPDTYVGGVPYEVLAELRRESPVVWLDEPAVDSWPAGPGGWAVLRHAEVKAVLRHPEVFPPNWGPRRSATRRRPRRWPMCGG